MSAHTHTHKTPYLYLRCWIVPRHLKDPLTMIASRVQRASHSSILAKKSNNEFAGVQNESSFHLIKKKQMWVPLWWCYDQCWQLVSWCHREMSNLWDVSTTARPSWRMLKMAFHRKRREWGSIPVVGSSLTHTHKGKETNPYLHMENYPCQQVC